MLKKSDVSVKEITGRDDCASRLQDDYVVWVLLGKGYFFCKHISMLVKEKIHTVSNASNSKSGLNENYFSSINKRFSQNRKIRKENNVI